MAKDRKMIKNVETKDGFILRTISYEDNTENQVQKTSKSDRQKKKIEKVKSNLDEFMKNANNAVETMASQFSELIKGNDNVKNIDIEFGIAFNEKASVWVLEAGAAQSMKVKLTLTKNG